MPLPTKAQASTVLRLTTLDLTGGEIRDHITHLRKKTGEFPQETDSILRDMGCGVILKLKWVLDIDINMQFKIHDVPVSFKCNLDQYFKKVKHSATAVEPSPLWMLGRWELYPLEKNGTKQTYQTFHISCVQIPREIKSLRHFDPSWAYFGRKHLIRKIKSEVRFGTVGDFAGEYMVIPFCPGSLVLPRNSQNLVSSDFKWSSWNEIEVVLRGQGVANEERLGGPAVYVWNPTHRFSIPCFIFPLICLLAPLVVLVVWYVGDGALEPESPNPYPNLQNSTCWCSVPFPFSQCWERSVVSLAKPRRLWI